MPRRSLRKYGFIVNKKANKVQIKKAVENLYGVTVESVNTMFYAGKRKSRFTKTGVCIRQAEMLSRRLLLPCGKAI